MYVAVVVLLFFFPLFYISRALPPHFPFSFHVSPLPLSTTRLQLHAETGWPFFFAITEPFDMFFPGGFLLEIKGQRASESERQAWGDGLSHVLFLYFSHVSTTSRMDVWRRCNSLFAHTGRSILLGYECEMI